MKNFLGLLVLMFFSFTACHKKEKEVKKPELPVPNTYSKYVPDTIPYRQMANYVLKDVSLPDTVTFVKITKPEEFDQYFQGAGDSIHKPTEIDFTKNYLIAVFNEKYKRNSILKPNDLKLIHDTIKINYQQNNWVIRKKDSRSFFGLIVSNQWQGILALGGMVRN